MKKLLLVLVLVGIIGVIGCATETKEAEARERREVDWCSTPLAGVMNTCQDVDPNYEAFDYGTYLDLILWEGSTKGYEIGIHSTYEVERKESTVLLGAKIYLNRLWWQSEK